MNNLFITAFLLFLIFLGCKKPKSDDIAGTYEIKVVLYYHDTLRGVTIEQPLSNHPVQVKALKDSSSRSFLFEQRTNSMGHVTIPNLSAADYILYAEITRDDILFSQQLRVNPLGNDGTLKMILYPDARQFNILSIITRDHATNGFLTNTEVCLFSSKLLADSNRCEGSIVTKKTDTFGQILFTRLMPGRYYIHASDSVGNVNIRTKDSVYLDAVGIVRKVVYLK